MLDRTTDIHTEQPLQELMLTGARTRMLAEACGQKNTQKEVRESMLYRSTCRYDCRSTCTDISADITGLFTESMGTHESTCPYISTKGTGANGGTSTDISMVKTVVRRRTNTYDK